MQWDFPLSGFEIGENMSSREVLISFPIGRHELFPPSKSGETEARRAEGLLGEGRGEVGLELKFASAQGG